MPLTIESRNTTTPRMSGQPEDRVLFLDKVQLVDLFDQPVLVRQTMACAAGPRMRLLDEGLSADGRAEGDGGVGFCGSGLLIWLPRLK